MISSNSLAKEKRVHFADPVVTEVRYTPSTEESHTRRRERPYTRAREEPILTSERVIKLAAASTVVAALGLFLYNKILSQS